MSWLKKNKFLLLIVIIVLGAYSGYKYAYKPHKTIEELAINYKGSATEFISKASSNFTDWETKVVEINGTITSKDQGGVMLNEQIYCQLKDSTRLAKLTENQKIQIKGRVIGYDDLLEELKLNQCILTK